MFDFFFQHTIVLFEVVWICFILYVGRNEISPKFWWHALSFCAGLLPYSFLVWRSANPPPGSWGDCSTAAGTRLQKKATVLVGQESECCLISNVSAGVSQQTYENYMCLRVCVSLCLQVSQREQSNGLSLRFFRVFSTHHSGRIRLFAALHQ